MTATETPVPTRIPSLRQFAEQRWQDMREEYGVTLREVRELYPVPSFEGQWWATVRDAVEAGVLPSGKLWRSLTDHEQLHLLRTRRALGDAEFTRQLVDLKHPDRRRRVS